MLATLNLAIPILDENTTVKIEEPPTKQQYVIYWGLNALDIYTTYRALKNPNIIEGNPLLGKNPSLDKLILFKAFGATVVGNNLDTDMMVGANATLTYIVYRNYKVMNRASDQLKNNN